MRIIRFFFIALVSVIVLAFLAVFLGREVLLAWQVSMLKNDYQTLLQGNHANLCTDKFAYQQNYWSQLRFTSATEYKLEVVCADFTSDPIVLEEKKLLPLVTKTSAGSGFIKDERKLPYLVELTSLQRKVYLYTDDQVMHANYLQVPDLDYELGPASSCQAHNYQCCSVDLESGLGEPITTATDCPKSCYASCVLKPQILLFNGQPDFDEQSRTLEAKAGETVSFSYVIANGKEDVFAGQLQQAASPASWLEKVQTFVQGTQETESGLNLPISVTLDFGDGQTWQSANLQDGIDHRYSCSSRLCYFQVKLAVEDAQGVLSADTELAKMIIKINK